MNYFSQKITVDVHDVDFNGVCRASALLRYIQSAAQQQLTDRGMSYDALKEMGKAFIISRLHAEFTSSVRTYDKLEAETFPCESRGFSFLRCYRLIRNGEVVGRAISVWALIDISSRALVKVADFDLDLPTYAPLDIALNHIRMPSSLSDVGEYTVGYSDLDQNRHINNTKYADIFSNFLPLDKKRISSLTISYLHDAKWKEKLRILRAEEDGAFYIRTVKEDGTVNADARIELSDI